MLKKEARKLYREKRKAISHLQKQKWDDLILIQFQKLRLPFLHNVFSFLPIEKKMEPETRNITRYLQFLNPHLKVAYPASDFTSYTMRAVVTNEETEFVVNDYGIAEPAGDDFLQPGQIDLVIVPMLCFDEAGYRVGYGKGFYDKFLAKCRNDVIKIGLNYFDAVDVITDRDEFDVALDYCVTPHQIYSFKI